jgi:AcrR family transcriptional regulator
MHLFLKAIMEIQLPRSISQNNTYLYSMESRKFSIVKEAARLFRKQGYTATSMQDIADELGIKAASLYNHISSKHEILELLLLSTAEDFVKGMKDIRTCGLDPLQQLNRVIALHVRLTVEEPNKMALVTEDWRNLNKEAKDTFLNHRNSYDKDFRTILQEGVENGFFDVANIDIAVFSILSTLRWFFSWYLKHRDLSDLELELYLQKTLLGGIIK